VVHLVSSLQVGGMEHFVLRIAAEQRKQGHDAWVLALNGGPLLETARAGGLPVRVLSGGKVARVAQTAALLATGRPHVIHPHNPSSLHYALVGKRVSGARLALTYHGRGLREARTPGAGEWLQTDAVISVSEGAVEQLPSEVPSSRVHVIRNGVVPAAATRSREEVRQELGLDDRTVGIIVARVDGQKGHGMLLQALPQVRRAGHRLTLLVAGDGAERAALESLAGDLGLGPDEVRFLGFRSDVPDLLAASDFFLLPSRSEGLPLSLLEAMTHGLPAVATSVGGIPEVIRSGEHGFLVPVDDAPALADAIARLCADPTLLRRLGDQARTRARDDFSFERMTREYLDLYAQLVSARAS
jgi:glycosyltransferase involved in cell wall biosynthesis